MEEGKEPAKEPAKEVAKEPAKEVAKEPAKEPAKEVAKEPAKEVAKEREYRIPFINYPVDIFKSTTFFTRLNYNSLRLVLRIFLDLLLRLRHMVLLPPISLCKAASRY